MVQALAFAIVSVLVQGAISYAFPSEGPRLKDLSISSSTYGNIIPEVFGTTRVGGNMIWGSGIKEHKKKKKAGVGSYSNQYTYSANIAMAFCKGPAQILRIWANGKLIYDATGASTHLTNGRYQVRLYSGAEDQLPDPMIQADKGAANTPAYRGLAYAAFENFDLANYGNMLPQFAAQVYCGPDAGLAVVDLVPMGGSPSLTTSTAGNTCVDWDQGYIYIPTGPDFTPPSVHSGIRRFRLSDGIEDRQITSPEMGLVPTSGSDLGIFGGLMGVMGESSPVVTTAPTNNYQTFDTLDPFSYAKTSSVGVSGPANGLIPTGVRPLVFNESGSRAISISLTGTVQFYLAGQWVISLAGPVGNGTKLTPMPGTVQFGNLYDTRGACASEDDFYVIYGGGIFSTPNVLNLMKISKLGIGSLQEGVSQVFTMNNPDPLIAGYKARWMAWDSGSPGVLIFHENNSNAYLSKWSPTTGTLVWTLKLKQYPPIYRYEAKHILTGEIAYVGFSFGVGSKLWIIDTINGKFVDRNPAPNGFIAQQDEQVSDVLHVPSGTLGYDLPSGISDSDQIFSGSSGMLVVTGAFGSTTPAIIHTGSFVSASVTLGYIVERLLRDAGLASGDFDLTALYSINVKGFGFASPTDVKSILASLRQIFLFDLVEIDGKLVATLRSDTTSVESINYLALASQGGDSPNTSDYWKETRTSEADLPSGVSLTYMNSDNDFQVSTARSKRIVNPLPTMFSRQVANFEASVVFDPTEAKIRVNAMLYIQWGERVKHTTKLPWAYSYLVPSDLITVTMSDGRTFIERIEFTETGSDFSINTETRGQDSGAYLQSLIGDGGGFGGAPKTVDVPTPAKAFIFNLPYLRDFDAFGDGTYSIYYAGAGNASPQPFNGAHLFLTTDGQNYNEIAQEDKSVEWGSITGIVPPASHGVYALDWVTQILVWPGVSGVVLESISYDDLWAGGNLSIVGREVIQFKDALDNGNGSWTLSNLLRGRRGTEWACDTHTIGEFIVFLDPATIDILQEGLDGQGRALSFKAVGFGRDLGTTPTATITYEPRDLMPYAPANIIRTVSGSDAVLAWSRRTRIGGNLMDGTGDVPLQETSELYEIYILAAPFSGDASKPDAPVAYLRKYTATSPTITYLAAAMATDGFTLATDTLHVVVYQLSGVVGRGFPASRDIEFWRAQ